ncbi:MAG: hypothetical protein KAR64_07770 [Thermoplasmatales archaeon]|nr:hypothetical protein [Thermoplasmatales archaeon]
MKDKIGVVVGAGIAALVIVGVFFYLLRADSLEFSNILMVIIPIILAIGAIVLLWDKIKSNRAGLPSADERAKKLHWKAGAYTYYATIWIAVGTMWYNIIFADNLGFPELTAGQVVAVIVLLSAVLWFVFQFYFMRKGDA